MYAIVRWGSAGLFAAIVIGLIVSIVSQSSQAFAHSGIGFLWSGTWNPDAGDYAGGHLVVGTVITTFVAMIIVVPIGLGISVSLSELMPRWLAGPLSTSIEFLAAVPSIVVGLWALLVLSPVFATDVEPALEGLPVLNRIFRGPAYGPSVLLASVVLAIMTLPTVVALSRTALGGVPIAEREAAMALGATHWQVVRRTVLPGARVRHRRRHHPGRSGGRSVRASPWRWSSATARRSPIRSSRPGQHSARPSSTSSQRPPPDWARARSSRWPASCSC